jgi:hypothetical protein
MTGHPPVGFDSRIKRGALFDSSGAGQVQSARLADESDSLDRSSGDDKDKPNSARLDSDNAKTKRGVITERSSSFTFGDNGMADTNSTTSVRVVNTSVYSKSSSKQKDFRHFDTGGTDTNTGMTESQEDSVAALDSIDGDKSIQWAPLSSTAMSPSAPGEYVAEQYAHALKAGLETMESFNSAMEWREMILNEDIKDWDDESVSQLQEMYSPRY